MTNRARFMTLVTAGCSLAKRATVTDGVVCSTADPYWPSRFRFVPIEVTDPGDLLEVLSTVAEERIAPCVVRAEPKAEAGRRAIYDDPEKGPAGMFPAPRAWVGFDIEKVPNTPKLDPLRNGEAIARYVQQCLPPPFRRSTAVWQLTASAGKRLDELRCHLWYLLDTPLDGKQIAAWCKPGISMGWIDPCTLTNVVLPHFLAVQIEGDQQDPCPQRWGIVRGEYDFIPVPAAVATSPGYRREHRADQWQSSTRGGNLDDLRRAYGAMLEPRRQEACAEIRAHIETVRAAGKGARHPSYLHAAAAIEGICRYWCIDINQPREDLVEAYLSTLSPDEARKRERGSTEGVWDWLERRSPPVNDDTPLAERLARAVGGQGGGQ
jgi:hypothetical protein